MYSFGAPSYQILVTPLYIGLFHNLTRAQVDSKDATALARYKGHSKLIYDDDDNEVDSSLQDGTQKLIMSGSLIRQHANRTRYTSEQVEPSTTIALHRHQTKVKVSCLATYIA